jgi:hypothetical protein
MTEGKSNSNTSSFSGRKSMTIEERRLKRQMKKQSKNSRQIVGQQEQERFQALMTRNEDELLEFVAQVNSVYQDVLKKKMLPL